MPKFSIAAKLYAIFALVATITLALAVVAVVEARRHAAMTEEFRTTFDRVINLQRIDALVYAAAAQSREVISAVEARRRAKVGQRAGQIHRSDHGAAHGIAAGT